MLLIVQVWSTSKLKLNYRDLSNQVWPMMKTRQDNDVTNRTGMIYTENNTDIL